MRRSLLRLGSSLTFSNPTQKHCRRVNMCLVEWGMDEWAIASERVCEQLTNATELEVRREVHFVPLDGNLHVVFTNVDLENNAARTPQTFEERMKGKCPKKCPIQYYSTTEVCRNWCSNTQCRLLPLDLITNSAIVLNAHFLNNGECVLQFTGYKWNANITKFFSMLYCSCSSNDQNQLIRYCQGMRLNPTLVHFHYHHNENGNDAGEVIDQPEQL